MDRISLLNYQLVGAPDDHESIREWTHEWSSVLNSDQKLKISFKMLRLSHLSGRSQWYHIKDDFLFNKWELRNSGHPVATLFTPLVKLVRINMCQISYRWNLKHCNKQKIADGLDSIVSDYERNLLPEPCVMHVIENFSDIYWEENVDDEPYTDNLCNLIAYDPNMPEGQRFSIR